MPPLNLLLFPLLGGFIFSIRWYPVKYYALRADSYRLVFTSSIAGTAFLLLSCFLVYICKSIPVVKDIATSWHLIVPYADSGKTFLAFVLGFTFWIPLNWFSDYIESKLSPEDEKTYITKGNYKKFFLCKWIIRGSQVVAINKAINQKADPMEIMLRNALYYGEQVSISTASSKVYRGKVVKLFNPAFDKESIELYLFSSGYRDKEDMHIVTTINYEEGRNKIVQDVVKEARKKNKALTESELIEIGKQAEDEIYEAFTIVLPFDQIQSVNFYDEGRYNIAFGSPKV